MPEPLLIKLQAGLRSRQECKQNEFNYKNGNKIKLKTIKGFNSNKKEEPKALNAYGRAR